MSDRRKDREGFPQRHPGPQAAWRHALDLAQAGVADHEPFLGIVHGQALRHVAQSGVETHVGLPQRDGILTEHLDRGRHGADLVVPATLGDDGRDVTAREAGDRRRQALHRQYQTAHQHQQSAGRQREQAERRGTGDGEMHLRLECQRGSVVQRLGDRCVAREQCPPECFDGPPPPREHGFGPRTAGPRNTQVFAIARLRQPEEAVARRGDGCRQSRRLADEENLALQAVPGVLDLAGHVHGLVELAGVRTRPPNQAVRLELRQPAAARISTARLPTATRAPTLASANAASRSARATAPWTA